MYPYRYYIWTRGCLYGHIGTKLNNKAGNRLQITKTPGTAMLPPVKCDRPHFINNAHLKSWWLCIPTTQTDRTFLYKSWRVQQHRENIEQASRLLQNINRYDIDAMSLCQFLNEQAYTWWRKNYSLLIRFSLLLKEIGWIVRNYMADGLSVFPSTAGKIYSMLRKYAIDKLSTLFNNPKRKCAMNIADVRKKAYPSITRLSA